MSRIELLKEVYYEVINDPGVSESARLDLVVAIVGKGDAEHFVRAMPGIGRYQGFARKVEEAIKK